MNRGAGLLAVLLTFSSFAQAVEHSEFSSTRRGIATVMFCGLGGAVLGLSTLSFYGKPEEKIGNIYLGLGLGLIAGTAYVIAVPEDQRSWSREEFSRPQYPMSTVRTRQIAQWNWEF